jgi:hypothetical protein
MGGSWRGSGTPDVPLENALDGNALSGPLW